MEPYQAPRAPWPSAIALLSSSIVVPSIEWIGSCGRVKHLHHRVLTPLALTDKQPSQIPDRYPPMFTVLARLVSTSARPAAAPGLTRTLI